MALSMSDEYVAPRTEIEFVVAEIWAKMLKIKCVGVFDNFFALGGHSVLITQITARIIDIFAQELAYGGDELERALINIFFAEPTVAALARQLVGIPLRPHEPASIAMDCYEEGEL
jgi:surfactin family lipopeptide synthetase C